MVPVIGITTYGLDDDSNYTLPAQYISATRRAGGIPVLIPAGETQFELLYDRLDAVILAGGGDIDPTAYGGSQHPQIYMVDAERDRMEIGLATQLIERRIPTLAICRGAQIVNIALGGSLYEHLPDEFGDEVHHRLPPREPTSHGVNVQPDSQLATILGCDLLESASWHHQSIKAVGTQLRVVARASDGVVEAVEMPGHPWMIAVQWHPELTAERDHTQQRLFDALVEAARRRT